MEDIIDFANEIIQGSKYENLLDLQKEILKKYKVNSKKSLGSIESPTGSGKTVVGAIIAEYWRAKLTKSVAYVTNGSLMEQVKQEMNNLKIECVLISGGTGVKGKEALERSKNLDRYNDSEVIGIFNYHSYLLSHGVKGADLVIIDDAHQFFETLRDQFSIRITNESHPSIYLDVITELRGTPADAEGLFSFGLKNYSDFALIDFKTAHTVISIVSNYLNNLAVKTDKTLYHSYHRNKENLRKYFVTITNKEIAITAFWNLLSLNNSIKNRIEGESLILMSATLPSIDEVILQLGKFVETDECWELDPKVIENYKTIGTRYIIPLPDMEDELSSNVNKLCKIVEDLEKILVISPSHQFSRKMDRSLEREDVVHYTGNQKQINNFKLSKKEVFVISGQYIGFSFDEGDCNVMILATIPPTTSSVDFVITNELGSENSMEKKLATTITQALGRLNRGASDIGIYVLADPRFIGMITEENKIFLHLSTEIQAQMKYGLRNLSKPNVEELIDIINKLKDSFEVMEYKNDITKMLAKRATIPKTKIVYSAYRYNEAFAAFYDNSFEKAAEIFYELRQTIIDEIGPNNEVQLMAYFEAWSHYLSLRSSENNDPDLDDKILKIVNEIDDLGDKKWFNRLKLLDLSRDDSQASEELSLSVYSKWRSDPAELFGHLHYQLRCLNSHDLLIKSCLKSMEDDNFISAGYFVTIFEGILKSLVREFETSNSILFADSYKSENIANLLTFLYVNQKIKLSTHSHLIEDDESLRIDRNLLLHAEKSIENETEAFELIIETVKIIDKIIYEYYYSSSLNEYLYKVDWAKINLPAKFKAKSRDDKISNILEWWSEGDKKLIVKESTSTMGNPLVFDFDVSLKLARDIIKL